MSSTKKLWISNTFTLSMIIGNFSDDELRRGVDVKLKMKKLNIDEARNIVREHEIISCVGHESTARFLSEILGINIPVNRVFITLKHDEEMLLTVLKERLPEGKVLSKEEIEKMFNEGKIELYLISIEISK